MILSFLPLFVLAALLISVFMFLKAKMPDNIAYKTAAALALLGALLLFWVNGAVAIIGSENNDANMMYGGVVAIGLTGAIFARFEPLGMARAMLATALAQALVAIIALVAGWGMSGPIWPRDVFGATVIFVILWLGCAWLFRRAAVQVVPAGAQTVH